MAGVKKVSDSLLSGREAAWKLLRQDSRSVEDYAVDLRKLAAESACSQGVPAARSPVLEWAHSSRHACHPGSRPTLAFVQQSFWWPTTVPDVSAFITTCIVCAPSTTSCPSPPLVSYITGLRHWSPSVRWQHHYIGY